MSHGAEHLAAHAFKPGADWKGHAGGKPVGTRNSINARFLTAMSEVFEERGKAAIERVATDDPATFVRALVALQPKQIEFKDPFDELTDEQLNAAYAAVQAILAAGQQDSAPRGGKAAGELSAVPEAG